MQHLGLCSFGLRMTSGAPITSNASISDEFNAQAYTARQSEASTPVSLMPTSQPSWKSWLKLKPNATKMHCRCARRTGVVHLAC